MNTLGKLIKRFWQLLRKIRVLLTLFLLKISYGKKFKYENLFFERGWVFDVWAKDFQVIMEEVSFRDNCKIRIRKNGKLSIGRKVFFNSGCSINCMESVNIGDFTQFGEGVKIYDHNHRFSDNQVLIKDQGYTVAPVNIGRNCWIGSNVIILKGVSIGDNVVIGANCMVNEDIPANSLVRNESRLIVEPIKKNGENS